MEGGERLVAHCFERDFVDAGESHSIERADRFGERCAIIAVYQNAGVRDGASISFEARAKLGCGDIFGG